MKLYTVILDYAGGTYIKQVRAKSVASALSAWCESDALQGVSGLSRRSVPRLIEDLKGSRPVRLNECQNVWCSAASTTKQLALINIVETVSRTQLSERSAGATSAGLNPASSSADRS